MYADGRDVRRLPLRDRKRILRELITFGGPLRFATHHNRDGEAYFAQACRWGWEGLIAKRADAPYRAGRGHDWLKFKCLNGQEFIIGGYTDPQRSRQGLWRAAARLLRRQGRTGLRGQGGHRVRRGDAGQPAPTRSRAWNARSPRSRAASCRGRACTGSSRSSSAGRVQRVDHRRRAAPSEVPGPAAGQGPGVGDQGEAAGREAMTGRRCGSAASRSSCRTPARCCSPTTASPRATW